MNEPTSLAVVDLAVRLVNELGFPTALSIYLIVRLDRQMARLVKAMERCADRDRPTPPTPE